MKAEEAAVGVVEEAVEDKAKENRNQSENGFDISDPNRWYGKE